MAKDVRQVRTRIFTQGDALCQSLATTIVEEARACQAAGGSYRLALTGGTTPRGLYTALAARHDLPWSALELFWSDERAVPRDHADSNYRMVRETLLAADPVAEDRLHPMVASSDLDRDLDDADLEEAAADYERVLRDATGADTPALDAVLLGLGPDGHIASLFPGAGERDRPNRLVVAVRDSPKPPPRRLTLTTAFINRSAAVHLIVTGASKADAVRGTLEGPHDPDRWPAQRLAPAHGTLTWWLDAAAASRLRQ
jgi:6-phosphogluconolactonase